jgi:hypothetical protein
MKKILFTSFFLLMSLQGYMQNVFTLDGTSGTRVYTHIDSAMKYAVDGDYLYLPGATINIPASLMVKKRLNIIGAGHYPDSAKATGITMISGNVHFWTTSSGSLLQGVHINGNIYFGVDVPSAAAKNILISRCLLLGSLHLSENGNANRGAENILIKENVFKGDLYLANVPNVLIENNFIEGGVVYGTGQVLVRNNIFLRRFGNAVNSSNSVRFESNVFMASGGFFAGTNTNLQFYHNIFKEGDVIGPSSTHVNNKFSITNLFISQSGTEFSYEQNYHLTSDSPAKNAGFDGKDCGIFGGANPYKEGAVPVNPHIRAKTLPAQTDAQGKINVQVTVAAQNN